MNRVLLFFLLSVLPLIADAQVQQVKFGYVSYSAALKAMPEYAIAQHNLDNLRQQYKAETKRSEDEFNRQYEDFLDGQKSFATSILNKRQAELKEMMDKNIAFRHEVNRLMEQATADAINPIKVKLNNILREIGSRYGYAFILNTDNDAVPYINSEQGEDIMQLITHN